MLELLQALAVRLAWMRPISVLVACLFAGLFAFAALADNAPQSFFTSGLAGLSWGLLVFTFLSVFQRIPDVPTEHHSRWQKFSLRVRRFGYGILGLATLGLTLGVIALTLKLL